MRLFRPANLNGISLFIALFIYSLSTSANATANTASTQPSIASFADHASILTDPILTGPTPTSINVVWYVEGGEDIAVNTKSSTNQHYVLVGTAQTRFDATSTPMSQLFEDKQSQLPAHLALNLPDNQALKQHSFKRAIKRPITRVSATVTDIPRNQRTEYRAISVIDGVTYQSDVFSLQPLPSPEQPVKVLVTSDQQNRHMSPANFQKVVETVGMVDAVLFAGDLVDTPNRASEWFDRNNVKRPAFYPALQGRFQSLFPEHPYAGGAILQHAPLLGTIGNHESPGRFDLTKSLGQQDSDPRPRWFAQWQWSQLTAEQQHATGTSKAEFLIAQSYDHRTYYEMWDLPQHGIPASQLASPHDPAHEPENFYAIRFGNLHLTSLNISRVWRNWDGGLAGLAELNGGANGQKDTRRGKFAEPPATINNLDTWGFGDMFFADYAPGSSQRQWLAQTLASPSYTSAPYKVVLTHQSMHGYGDNAVPVMANPVATIDFNDNTPALVTTFPTTQQNWRSIVKAASKNKIAQVRYQYPREQDLWLGVEQELLAAKANLVISGHSHVWSRTYVDSIEGLDNQHRLHYIETSNVGNSFGPKASQDLRFKSAKAFFDGKDAQATLDEAFWPYADYLRYGDPHARPDVVPSEVANGTDLMHRIEGAPIALPYISSNRITVFTIIDTAEGTVNSYGFDTAQPDSQVFLVDSFKMSGY